MKEKLAERIILATLIFCMAINVFMLFHVMAVTSMESLYREKKAVYTLPDGFTPAKTKITWDESLPKHSGWVVRYASRECIYCNLDFEWERLIPQLERLNYRTVLLLPNESDQFDEDRIIPETAQQMAFVKMDWIKQFRFTGTPIIVIFDNNGRVLWHRGGILNEDDYKSAERTIVKNAKG